jgi:hypothetical protein
MEHLAGTKFLEDGLDLGQGFQPVAEEPPKVQDHFVVQAGMLDPIGLGLE